MNTMIVREFNIFDFPFYFEAKDKIEGLSTKQLERLGEHIESTLCTLPTADQINDFVSYCCDGFLAELRISES